jgi:hypothetical protein
MLTESPVSHPETHEYTVIFEKFNVPGIYNKGWSSEFTLVVIKLKIV